MSIFPEVTKDQIFKAMERFKTELSTTPEWADWSSKESFKYGVFHDFNLYPVKQIVSLATGISKDLFSGGDQANNFIKASGFKVVSLRDPNTSWIVSSGSKATKYMDKSAFTEGTAIPIEIRPFFLDMDLSLGEHRPITLIYNGTVFSTPYITVTSTDRTRMFWRGDFIKMLGEKYAEHCRVAKSSGDLNDLPVIALTFERIDGFGKYRVSFAEATDRPKTIRLGQVRTLNLHEQYTRKEVHNIFSPNTKFTPQAGTWGLQGIIEVPERKGDFVFFVTYGKKQGDHTFDEGLTEDGVLSWQSQPKQTLATDQIKRLVRHDDLKNNIYLFLRSDEKAPYLYLGTLGYLSHDTEREKPVHFQWQLMDWPAPMSLLADSGIPLTPITYSPPPSPHIEPDSLLETFPPPKKIRRDMSSTTFKTQKKPDYSAIDARNRELGKAGELLVMDLEIKALMHAGHEDLAARVRHVSIIEGDQAGYDILSYDFNGSPKYIEVKTTRGPAETDFFMSSNELAFASDHKEAYYLYRVFDYDKLTNTAKFYKVTGYPADSYNMRPTHYRVSCFDVKL